jgi:dUTP pyrophosphatase
MQVEIINLSDNPLPEYQTEGSAGMDLAACLNVAVALAPGEQQLISTGIQIALPIGYEAQIRSRSGLAAKSRVSVVNSPGTIDSDYRGEIKVILRNEGNEPFVIEDGDRIAQMVIAKYERVDWTPVQQLDATTRTGGFGSTGVGKTK